MKILRKCCYFEIKNDTLLEMEDVSILNFEKLKQKLKIAIQI